MGKALRNDNKGFSLVELIIVIAIMAILVGVMAPQLIKYIEKSNVSADTQMLDTIHTALVLAMTDPEVIMATDNSPGQIAFLLDPHPDDGSSASKWMTQIVGNTTFMQAVNEIVGWNVFDANEQREHMKSTPARNNGAIILEPTGEGSGFALWIVHSDSTGGKTDNGATSWAGVTDEIYVK